MTLKKDPLKKPPFDCSEDLCEEVLTTLEQVQDLIERMDNTIELEKANPALQSHDSKVDDLLESFEELTKAAQACTRESRIMRKLFRFMR